MKIKTVFLCNSCGFESPKWLGKCPGCNQWNTMTEETIKSLPSGNSSLQPFDSPSLLTEVDISEDVKILSGIGELDLVLGGGLVNGSLVLVGGDPGIGKSTLLLQAAANYSKQMPVLYVSGEESKSQIKLRANRLLNKHDKLYLLCETNIQGLIENADKLKPKIIVADSIQTLFSPDISSAPGSVSQVRECCLRLMQYAKSNAVSVFIVGHVTKDGAIAGPRVLEHMVDSVLYFEGEQSQSYRILRAVKNRFGSTNEIGVFEMQQDGLIEVPNPSAHMLSGRSENAFGSSIACCMEGTRPILTEIQALISPTGFGMPRRMAAGFDYNRMNMLIAVIEKHLRYNLQNCDAYINVAGGLKITETAADLPLIIAIISGFKGFSVPEDLASFGEVGLSGELRSCPHADRRIAEIAKMGFKNVIVPSSIKHIGKTASINTHPVKNLADVVNLLRNKFSIHI